MASSSSLLASLEARIAAAARDPVEAACLRAERAGLLARQGNLDEARAELAALRARHDAMPHVLVSAWLHLAEGLVLHFANESSAARDRMLRALALGTAVRSRPVRALSAAWLAHLDFAKLDFESMVRHVSIALDNAADDHHQALSRAAMVVAQSFHWAERPDLALPWYAKVRMHATAERDGFMLAAHMHNMAWMRCAQARRLSVMGKEYSAELEGARGGAESTSRYDELIGTVSLVSFMPILHAQIFVLQSRYREALDTYTENAQAATREGLDRLECCLLADRSWCRLHLGDAQGALEDARAALRSITDETQVDDRAMTRSRVAQVFRALGEESDAVAQGELAARDWQELELAQARLLQLLRAAVPEL